MSQLTLYNAARRVIAPLRHRPSAGPGRAKLLLSPICSLLPPEPTGNPPLRCRASRVPRWPRAAPNFSQ